MSGLSLNFVRDLSNALEAMRAVALEGRIAAYVWGYAGRWNCSGSPGTLPSNSIPALHCLHSRTVHPPRCARMGDPRRFLISRCSEESTR